MTRPAAPRFAMSFTQDAVILERHGPEGWTPLGQARFDHGDLARKLRALRDQAQQANGMPDSGGPDTVLIIPEDQILYTTLSIPPGPDPRDAVARALDGLTPYSIDELAFDWSSAGEGQGDALRVAAVARQTLDEAEDFATAQGFRPLRFTARPDDDRFPGQPDFGASALARAAEAELTARPAPDLASAGVTAPDIALPEDEPPAPPGPVVSRIVPHQVIAAPAPVKIAEEKPTPPKPAKPVVGPATVIRHNPGSAAARPLNPRAQAVQDRAAEARARRAAAPDPAPARVGFLTRLLPGRAPRPIGTASRLPDPASLPAMLGLLALGLIAALWLLGGSGSDQVETVEAPAPVVETPAEPAVEVAAAPEPQPVPEPEPAPVETATAPAPEVVAPEPNDPLTAALIEAMDTPVFEDTTEPGLDEDVPAAPTEIAAAPTEVEPAPAPVTPAPVETASANLAAAVDQAFATPVPEAERPRAPEPTPAPVAAAPAPAPASTAPAPAAPRLSLSRSARPQSAPSRAAAPAADPAPAVPQNPQPYAQRAEPPPPRVAAIRPAQRPARAAPPAAVAPAPTPVAARPDPAPAVQPTPAARPVTATVTSTARPPRKPMGAGETREEGSAAEPTGALALTPEEQAFLDALALDLAAAGLIAPAAAAAPPAEDRRLAQARPPQRRSDAVNDAVRSAIAPESRPATRQAAPATGSALNRSARPNPRPGGTRSAAAPAPAAPGGSIAAAAIQGAVAQAVAAPSAGSGLMRSAKPQRRPARVAAAAVAPAPQQMTATLAATPAATPLPQAAAAAQAAEAAQIAAQRREDEQLQAQAEARARARAQADARAEAQARAQAEARARAQAEAEARAAAARQQQYRPPEAENEPEVAAPARGGNTPTNVASAATVKNGITLNRTQIIGTVGADKGSRALVRLSNGRVVTLRIGDRINNGTITAIGDGRITYNRNGRQEQLAVLDGR